jgi:hypothetical protein
MAARQSGIAITIVAPSHAILTPESLLTRRAQLAGTLRRVF